MKKSELSDKQLEELLRQMPAIRDHRHPRSIYQNLSIKMKKRRYRTWFLPGIATISVLLLFLILAPYLLNGSSHSSTGESMDAKSSLRKVTDFSQDKKMTKMAKGDQYYSHKNGQKQNLSEYKLKTAIYDNEVGKGRVLTYWIPDQQAHIYVPVSTIINKSDNQTWIDLFNQKMKNLNEKEWGLSDYYPINATLKLDDSDNSVILDVPANHPYDQGSANEMFIEIMLRNISANDHIKKMKLTTNGQPGIMFGNDGEKKVIDVNIEKNRAYFFYFPNGKEIPFLVPSLETHKDMKAAMEAMRSDRQELGLQASLSSIMQFKSAEIKNKILYLSFVDHVKLINNPMTVYSYEAILLTAKEFGLESVKFENAPIKKLGPFDLSKENKVPIAPNYRVIYDQP